MPNSINGPSHISNNISQNNSTKEAPKQAGETQNSQSASSSAVLNLTNTAESLQTLQKKLADTPDIDKQKVDSIKLALTEGKYQIDAEKVAEKFIEIEKALGKV